MRTSINLFITSIVSNKYNYRCAALTTLSYKTAPQVRLDMMAARQRLRLYVNPEQIISLLKDSERLSQ